MTYNTVFYAKLLRRVHVQPPCPSSLCPSSPRSWLTAASISTHTLSPEDLHSMAPRLPPSRLFLIHDMVQSQSVTISQMAEAAECSKPTVKNIRRNLRLFGSVHAPPNRVGRRRSITPPILEALCDHLLEKPGLYLDEMVVFLRDEFQTLTTTSSIRRALASKGWSKKQLDRRPRSLSPCLR